MPTQPGIALQFQPTPGLVNAPQQAIAMAELGRQHQKRQQVMQLNQIPGMVEGGLYTDQGIMALSQIDPGLRDEAVQKRAVILQQQSQERLRKAQEDKIRDTERQDAIDEFMAEGVSRYHTTKGSEEARKRAMTDHINAGVDAMIKDGRAAKYGLTQEQIAKLRGWNSPDDIMLALRKHGKLGVSEYLESQRGAQALEEGTASATASQPTETATASPAPIGTENGGPTVKPYTPPNIEGQPLSDRPEVDEATFEAQVAEWDKYEQDIAERWRRGELQVDEYERELADIDAEKARAKEGRAKFAAAKAPGEMPDAPPAEISATPLEDYLAMAREEERKAKVLRDTGMPANLKRAKAHDQQARAYRDKAGQERRMEQGDRRLDQADDRIKIAIDRAKATQSALPEEAVNFVADQIIRGNAQAGAGLARNQVAKAQIITAYTRLAKERGMSPGDVNAAMNEFQGLQQASRTLGARSANIDVAAEELAQFVPVAEKASSAVPRTNFVPINRLIQLGEAQWSPQQAAFVAANRSVINAFAGLASRGVPTVHGTEEAEKMLSTAQTHEQYQATLRMLWNEAQAAIQATKNVRKHVRDAVTGKESKPESYPGDVPRETKPAAGGLPRPKTAAEASKLPPGTRFIDPDGVERVR
jgi:hypothetical protein